MGIQSLLNVKKENKINHSEAVKPAEIMQFMTHNSLHLYKKKGSRVSFTRKVAYEKNDNPSYKGVVFVSPSKEHLSNGKGYVVTSYETLHEKQNELTHWTPNTYRGGTYYDFKNRIIKGHTRENLKQINVIGFDIDTKKADMYALFLGCDELGLPRPNLLLETPKGYQVFFVLQTPFYIHKQQNYKSLRVAERLAANFLKALQSYVPIDPNCTPFGFYRIPREDNIVYFNNQPANTSSLLAWSKQFEEKISKRSLKVVFSKNNAAFDQTSSEWYRALIHAKNIESGHYSSSRNNTVFTLAIANYISGVSIENAYDELDQFNSNLEKPLSKSEFERILRSAYSGKYQGAKRSYVEGLLELWTDGKAAFQGREGWYKFKKPREERVRSHYEEREEDILLKLEASTSPEKPYFEGSLRLLAETFGMAISTLKEVLKRSQKLIKRTVGRGRNAVTMIASRSVLFKTLLLKRKKYIKHAQLLFREFLSTHPELMISLPFQAIIEELLINEVDTLYPPSTSPPFKLLC